MLITLSGLSGCGKSTAAKILAQRLGIPTVDVGAIFREMAEDHGMDVVAFGKYATDHPEIDLELDDRMVSQAKALPDLILQGRLSGHMAIRHALPAFKVWLEASPEVRAQRMAGREGGDPAATLALLQERDKDNQERYKATYGLDLGDLAVYDAVVRTDTSSPEQVVTAILTALHVWQTKPPIPLK